MNLTSPVSVNNATLQLMQSLTSKAARDSLRSKRLQLSYSAKVIAGAKKKKGRGRGEEETLARKPYDSGKRPLIFHGSVHL